MTQSHAQHTTHTCNSYNSCNLQLMQLMRHAPRLDRVCLACPMHIVACPCKLYNNYSSLCNFCYSINCVKSLCTHLLDLLGPSTEITKSRSCELPHQKHFAFSNKHLRQATKKSCPFHARHGYHPACLTLHASQVQHCLHPRAKPKDIQYPCELDMCCKIQAVFGHFPPVNVG